MAEFSEELIAKLKKAQSAEEVTELLKADGQDEAQADRLWKELSSLREQDGQELSPDELDAVSGGVSYRDWMAQGCAATVEPGSDCWGTDGGCTFVNIQYSNMPSKGYHCVRCGGYVNYSGLFFVSSGYLMGQGSYCEMELKCKNCGTYRIKESDYS